MKKTLLVCVVLGSTVAAQAAPGKASSQSPVNPDALTAYLFTYFSGNDPEKEQVCYAISDDGYNFTPLNGTIIPITEAEKQRLLKEYGPHNQPILPGFHADPEVLYSNKTKKYYIYSTTDGTPGWSGHDFSVFSSTDLVTWTDEGKMLDVKSDQVPWAEAGVEGRCEFGRNPGDEVEGVECSSIHTNRKKP